MNTRSNSTRTHPWACFVTGTDTEIGKTLVSCALLLWAQQQGLRALGIKPIAAGSERHNAPGQDGEWHNEDVDALAACSNVSVPQSQRTPYLLRLPAAPHLAAAQEGVRIDVQVCVDAFAHLREQAQAVVVEGVGGFRVPLNDTQDTADWAVGLGLPVVMVVGLRLGCINQALLTAEAIASRGLHLAGWVANTVDTQMALAQANVDALRQRIDAPLLGQVPRVTGDTPLARARQAAMHLNGALLSRW